MKQTAGPGPAVGEPVNASGEEPTGAPPRTPRWWAAALSSPVWRQVLVIVTAGAAVQALLWFRGDSAAHVVGGAALATFLGVTTPRAWLRWLDAWAELLLLGAVLGVAWVTEWTILGPFDPVDVAFTMAGAFVGLASRPAWIDVDRRTRAGLGTTAIVLAGAALTLRYVIGLGKA